MALLSEMVIGDIVRLNVNKKKQDFIVIHQGNPDPSVYDDSCNGTWLLIKDACSPTIAFDNDSYEYADSDLHIYLNDTIFNQFDSKVKAAIKQVKIPYTVGDGYSGTLNTGANGLSTKIFSLSHAEVNGASSAYAREEGVALQYFAGTPDSDSVKAKRIAYTYDWRNQRVAAEWHLRSPHYGGAVWSVSKTGGFSSVHYMNTNYPRPAFILPSDFEDFEIGGGAIKGSVNIGGTYKELCGGYVNVGGVWKELCGSYVNIGGTWKQTF